MLNGSCNCSTSENFDFCKHCVATALAYKDKKAEQSQLQDDDLLTNKWVLKADSASGFIDIKQLKKQITKALPYLSLWEYAKVRTYFANAEAALEPVFDIFTELDTEDVFSLTQYMSQRLNKLLEQLDDSGGYRYGLEGEINEKLTVTFKQLPWSAKKKSQFLVKALITDNDYMVYPEIPEDFLDSSTQDVNELYNLGM